MMRHQAVELLIYAAIAVFLLFTTLEPNYQNLKQDTIVIQSIEIRNSNQGFITYSLESGKNQTFRVTVDKANARFQEEVRIGTEAKIKYFTDWPSKINYIREMFVDGEVLVPYHENWKSSAAIIIMSMLSCGLLGLGFLWMGIAYRKKSHFTKEKTKELKRRARLNKTER